MDINKIKYYPDKFYICLDGFDLDNLDTFTNDVTFSQQQAIYLHEYYHYLTNITTFAGLREFNLVFQDKIRIITRISAKAAFHLYFRASFRAHERAFKLRRGSGQTYKNTGPADTRDRRPFCAF